MSFRTRLVAGLFALTAALGVSVVLVADQVLARVFERSSIASLEIARGVLESAMQARHDRMRLVLRPLEEDARVKANLGARAELGSAEGGEAKVDEYLRSWIDELAAAREDLFALIGRNGRIAYGRAGEKGAVVGDEILGSAQVSALLGALAGEEQSVQMLWSGPRLREGEGATPALGRSLYHAAATKLIYRGTGVADQELAGIAVVATSRLELERIAATGADVLLVDGEAPLIHTLGRKGAAEGEISARVAAAARWIQSGSRPAQGERAALELAGTAYYALPFDPPGMINGPVRGAILYSREAELLERAMMRTQVLGATAALLLVALGVGIVLSRRVSQPVLALAAAARSVGEGDLTVRVEEASRDELGELARRFNAMVQGLRERELAHEALGRYLSPQMANQLIAHKEKLSLHGERRILTVLFSDIAGFTSLAEMLSPERTVELLNEYLREMVEVLFDHGAYIDKFEGDGVMAFWGAPLDQPDHAVRGCLAALQMRKRVHALGVRWKEQGLPELKVRFGLNTGPAVVGNLGSASKVNYTAIGDEVNLASRLEGVNRAYRTELIIGAETWRAASAAVVARELDWIRVKGRVEPVAIYELCAPAGELDGARLEVHLDYAEGLAHYRAKKFEQARRCFLRALEKSGGDDGPSAVMAERCGELLGSAPTEASDVFEMRTK